MPNSRQKPRSSPDKNEATLIFPPPGCSRTRRPRAAETRRINTSKLNTYKESENIVGSGPRIEAPPGFINVAALSPALARQLCPSIKNPSDIVGFFVSPDAAAALLKNGVTESTVRYQATKMDYRDEAALDTAWVILTKNFRKESLGRFDVEDPSSKKVLAKYERAVGEASNGRNAVKIEGATTLGIVNDTAILISGVLIMATDETMGDEKWKNVSVACGGYLKAGRSLLSVNVIMPFNGESSIVEARDRFNHWMKQCRALDESK